MFTISHYMMNASLEGENISFYLGGDKVNEQTNKY
jgi:hypothetical protein